MKKINAILFFIAAGRPTSGDQEAATALAASSGERVVFRNASAANRTGERPEACLGVAGAIPETYSKFKAYDSKGGAKKPLKVVDNDEDGEDEVNKLGLPLDAPATGKDLKKYFTDNEIVFHPKAKVDVLVQLYRVNVLGEEAEEV